MAGVEGLVHVWREWGIQVLVLLSFALQVILLITAEIRRLNHSGLLKAIVWSAYVMADSTAIYALGHMFVTRRSPEHQLMAFWAPFLLLHLGGQDNITAYAIEDNRLWLRHLQAFGVQTAAAAFVLYEFFILGGDSMILCAAILMIVTGFLKYGERVWALKCASASNLLNKNYRSGLTRMRPYLVVPAELKDTEDLLRIAHFLLNIPKKFFERPLGKTLQDRVQWHGPVAREKLFSLTEMQLALMHDVLYSKAEVMHTWYGLSIRIISWASTAVAFVLFHWSGHRHGYSRADVAITYALLVGAIVLETISLLRFIFSSWALADMRRFRRMVLCEERRYWSNSMGQHNLFEVYGAIKTSRRSRIARRMGYEDWWNTRTYSRRIPVSKQMKAYLGDQFFKLYVGHQRGRLHFIMKQFIYNQAINYSKEAPAARYDECIVVWHIATNVYLRWYKKLAEAQEQVKKELVETIEVLSNYMLFILVARPSMLPKFDSPSHYAQVCYDIAENKFDSVSALRDATSTEDFLGKLQVYGDSMFQQTEIYTLWRGSRLGRWLIGNPSDTVDTLASNRLRETDDAVVLNNSVTASVTIGTLVEDRISRIEVLMRDHARNLDFFEEGDVLNKINHESMKIDFLAEDELRLRAGPPGSLGDGADVLKQIFVASATINRLATDRLSIIDGLMKHPAHSPNLEDEAGVLGKIVVASATIDELMDFNGIFDDASVLDMIAVVWAKILFDASGADGLAYSHAKQLSNGGELLTIAAIMMTYMQQVGDAFPESDPNEMTGAAQTV
jgi:hypothetical protein